MTKIIGGPIVRRVSATQAYLWVIIEGDYNSLSASTPKVSSQSSVQSVALQHRLVACLIRLDCSQEWPDGQPTSYDIAIDGRSVFDKNSPFFYNSIPLYPGYSLPFFIYTSQHKRILSASCRKPHGGKKASNNQDALTAFDQRVEYGLNPQKLPTLLFLTGDQIYADDIEESLAEFIFYESQRYFPAEAIPSTHSFVSEHRYNCRDKILNKESGFYTGEGHCHLLGFGEYLTMYLTVWGGISVVDLPAPIKPSGKAPRHKKLAYLRKKADHEKVKKFIAESYRVRRLMAHISTYMTFDDHDVTDDWNLTSDIKVKLSAQGSIGQRVVTNALAAFSICQSWGNDPEKEANRIDQFTRTYVDSIQEYNQEITQKTFDALNKSYTFLTPTFPPVLSVDTRTQRTFRQRAQCSPVLVDDSELENITNKLRQLPPFFDSLIIISATPVYGFTVAEFTQLIASKLKLYTAADVECWIADEQQFNAFCSKITELPNIKDCFIFSGDVHYGFVRTQELKRSSDTKPVRLWQFTSSSVSNSPIGVLSFALNLARKLTVFQRRHTSYAIPLDVQNEFLTGDINLGLLDLSQPNQRLFKLLRPRSNGEWSDWVYNLEKPKLLTYSKHE